MKSRTSTRNQSPLTDASQARLAVEALFQTHQPRSEAADVDVVVKRRRIASTDHRVDGNDVAEVVADEVRAPRIFKVEKQQDGLQDGQEVPSNTDLQTQLSGAASRTFDVTQARRRRRRLNGVVTIIRPMLHEPNAVGDEFTTANSKPGSNGDSQAESSDLGRFGVDIAAQSRYEKLMTRIARLESQAQSARKVEARAAVRWIKKAIGEYGLEARELGF